MLEDSEHVYRVLQDERPIKSITSHDGGFWRVGYVGITEILPYREEDGVIPAVWFAVYRGDKIAYRVAMVECVEYFTEGDR